MAKPEKYNINELNTLQGVVNITTPNGKKLSFKSGREALEHLRKNTPEGYSVYDTTNYGSNIDKSQTAILNRNTEREIEKAIEQEKLTDARLATRQQNQEIGKEMLSYMPVIGDGMDLYQLGKDAYNGNYLNAGIGLGLLALPNVIEKPLKYVGKGIKKLFTKANEKSNIKFTDNLDINKDNKSYKELAEKYTDDWFDFDIKSSKDINDKNLQNITDEEWDKLYNKAIKNNDLKEAQKLRDLHFKQKTPNNKVINKQYHVVGDYYDPNFTIFDPKENHTSIYTTDNINMASSYSKYWLSNEEKLKTLNNLREKDISDKNKIIKYLQEELKYRQNNNKSNNYKNTSTEDLKAILDIKLKELELLNDDNNLQNYYKNHYNFYNTIPQPNRVKKLNVYLENPIQIDNNGYNWNNIRISGLPKDVYDNIKVDRRGNFLDAKYSTLSLENVSKDLEYDGVIIDNITDYGKHWGNKYIDFNIPNQVVITNNKNRLKLSDAITYDDNGNIIPLSKRDDFTNPDIRYNWLLPTIGVGTGLSLMNNETSQYKTGGKLISKFKNSGKVRLYTNPFFNQNISPLDPDLKEGIDYNLVTQEYYNLYKNKLKAKELGAEGYFESNLWESENPIKKGYNKNTNTWGSYNDGTGDYVGPGVDFNLYGTKEEINKIKNKILSSGELNNMIKRVVKLHSNSAEKLLSKYTSRSDTISPLIKAGFYDILYQSGPYSKWKNLSKAIVEGNLLKIHEEAKTYTKANKKKKLDTRRLNERKNKYFHY